MDQTYARELQLEDMASQMGVMRYNKERPLPWREDTSSEREEASLAPGKHLMNRAVPQIAERIEEFLEASASGKAGRRHTAVRFLAEVDAEAAAYITCRRIINALMKGEKTTAVGVSIAGLIEDHIRLHEFEQGDDKALLNSTLRQMKSSHASHRRKVLRHALRTAEVRELEWAGPDKVSLGLKLIEMFIEVTGLAEAVLLREGKRTTYHLRPTEAVKEWLGRMHEEQALLAPIHLPMVVPPRDWVNPVTGGYLRPEVSRRITLMRTAKKNTVDDLFSTDMPEVYDAVNAIQRTPWKINRPVYETARAVWAEGGGLGGIPNREDEPIPARPFDIPEDVPLSSLDTEDQKRLKEWKGSASQTYSANAKMMARRLSVSQQLWTAGTFIDDKAIFFPHTLDFRGRIYAVPVGLNPQGDDLAKGLLTFSEGKPVGKDGGFWLAVHVANVFGVADKAPLAERVAWTEAHTEELLDSADNPLDGARFWASADGGANAWQGLAAAAEWAAYVRSGRSEDFVSSLPVAMDGSCSGLQHFSAMLRDEVGGTAVNLVPDTHCHDIYTEVAEKVEALLAKSDDEIAKLWRGKVERKIVKQPCMTFAYSVSSRGIIEQIIAALKKIDPTGMHLEGIDYFPAAVFLGPLVEKAIRSTVIAAATAMDWLKDAAGLLADDSYAVVWSAPTGLPIRQDETKFTSHRRKVWFQGRRIELSVGVDTKKIDKQAQKSGIAPNFVHSMDAAHLMKTVNASTRAGIKSFAMIHDSFGTHAADIGEMGYILRREFVLMYSPAVLEQFRDGILEQLSPEKRDKLRPLPRSGALDLTAVTGSDFFFA